MTRVRPYQIILDTNVILSGLRSNQGASFQLLDRLPDPAWQLNLSVQLVLEYEEVIKRETHMSAQAVDGFIRFLCSIGNKRFNRYFVWRPVARDPDDEFIIDLAIQSRADIIVTFNISHLAPARQFGIHIMKPKEFLRLLEDEQ